VVLLLLTVCISVDYADDNITIVSNKTVEQNMNINVSETILVNGTHYSIDNETGIAKLQNVVTEKPKYPTITMTGKPSCTRCARNGCAYTWRTKTYINYCPNCYHYNCLGNKHKWGSTHEQEITCFRCDSDYCVNCGKEKYSWSNVYLKKG